MDPIEAKRRKLEEAARKKRDAALVMPQAEIERISAQRPAVDLAAAVDGPDDLDRLRAEDVAREDAFVAKIQAEGAAKRAGLRKCVDCAEWIQAEARVCKHCGHGRRRHGPGERKSPFVAGALSFLVPGAGNAYAGDAESAVIYFLLTAGCWAVFAATVAMGAAPCSLVLVGVDMIVWLAAIISAEHAARRFNERR